MWTYWLMFLVPAAMALQERPKFWVGLHKQQSLCRSGYWLVTVLGFALLIGFRQQVGADWGAYLPYLDIARDYDFFTMLGATDPGYMLLNWISVTMGWGIYGVNFLAGLIVMLGVAQFCRKLPRPYLALSIAIPYFLIVVVMGYSRQGTACGIVMCGLTFLIQQQRVKYVFSVFFAAAFHSSAIILLPLAILAASSKRQQLSMMFFAFLVAIFSYLLLQEKLNYYIKAFLIDEMQSSGAFVRGVMNALPATLFMSLKKRFAMSQLEKNIWLVYSFASIIMTVLVMIMASTTAIDRLALYLIPIQIVVFAHLPGVLGRSVSRNISWILLILSYYATVLGVWLGFSDHAFAWLPFRFYPLDGVF